MYEPAAIIQNNAHVGYHPLSVDDLKKTDQGKRLGGFDLFKLLFSFFDRRGPQGDIDYRFSFRQIDPGPGADLAGQRVTIVSIRAGGAESVRFVDEIG